MHLHFENSYAGLMLMQCGSFHSKYEFKWKKTGRDKELPQKPLKN